LQSGASVYRLYYGLHRSLPPVVIVLNYLFDVDSGSFCSGCNSLSCPAVSMFLILLYLGAAVYETIPFEIAPFIDRVNQRVRNEFHILHEELRQIKEDWLDAEGLNDLELVKGIAAAKELIELKNKYKLSAIAIQNFFSISSALGEGAAIYTMIASESFPISDESDIHGAISSVMLNSAKETTDPVFFPEYVIRHPEDDNIVCLWL
jgi:hypothetical protein